MNEFSRFFLFLFAAAVTQNMVLTTGFGSSVLLRIMRSRHSLLAFSALLSIFSLLTVMIAYPLDNLIGTSFWAKLLRPLMIVGIAIVLYCLAALILSKAAPDFYAHYQRLLPLAAFNNLVIGIALIANHSFAISLFGAIGLALGACIGFVLLSWLTAEGISRTDNPAVPAAFRGMPITLIYIGLLALAILGFRSSISLI